MAKAYLKPVDTEWPTVVQIAPSTKKLIHDYFEILDANTADAGEKLATRIFTKDATFKTSSASFIGYEEIKGSRDHAWDSVKERMHQLVKVYTSNDDGSDLLALGEASIVLSNGKKVDGNLIARLVLVNVGTEDVRVKYFQVWGDSGPMLKALQEDA